MAIVEIKDRKIHCLVSEEPLLADRKTLLFVHGAGGNKIHWINQFDGLKGDFNVIVAELPGHGESSPQGANRVERYAEDIAAVIDSLAPAPPIVVGHSMGGAICQILALDFRDKVTGLVLIGTGCRLRVLSSILDGLLTNFDQTVSMINRYAFSKYTDEDIIQESSSEMAKTPPAVIHGDFLACNRFDLCERIREITQPTLILCGTDDQLTPVKYSQFLLERIPNATLSTFPRAGHMLMVEAPEEVNRAIREFAASIP
jgi:pimeloyl-ACP methyl ester carboxylesterase